MVQLAGLTHRELQHLLGARGIREIGARRLRGLTLLDRLLDLLLDLVQLDVQVLEDGGRNALALANEPEQNVLRSHVLVVEARRLLTSHREDLSYPLGEIVAVHGSLKSG